MFHLCQHPNQRKFYIVEQFANTLRSNFASQRWYHARYRYSNVGRISRSIRNLRIETQLTIVRGAIHTCANSIFGISSQHFVRF